MNPLEKMEFENDFDYHKRIVYGKLVDRTLADQDYTELSELVYGKRYSSDVARRMMYGSCRTLELLDKTNKEQAAGRLTSGNKNVEKDDKTDDRKSFLDSIDKKTIELKKERQKMFDERAALNKVIRERSRQEELNDIITRTLSDVRLPSLPSANIDSRYTSANTFYNANEFEDISMRDNDLLVSLNDIHYGADIDNHWNRYNSDIFKNMLLQYARRIIDIGISHASERCIVWANGDFISGSIHHSIAVSNKENVIEQIMGVSELIAGFLSQLSGIFPEVWFLSVAGNHSRIDSKDKALKDERLDDLVQWYLEARLSDKRNIIFSAGDKIDSTMYIVNIRGKTYCGVHGDYDGTPSKIQTLQTMAGTPIYAVLSGHLHHNKIDNVQGIKSIMAGSFMGMDDYCISRRIYGRQEQLVCVCNANGVLCSYNIDLSNVENY